MFPTTLRLAGCAILGALALSGCKPKSADTGGGGGAAAFAVQVVAVEARRQPVVESLSLIGTIAPNESVELKAEADGIVQDINFTEGQRVEKGQVLIRLDETKLAAVLEEAEANLKLSAANHERARQLLKD
ncbi:MAG TPA: biotin/lipoyl-binding protein, partial [Verrucomicrobiae bacterium]|nr:biotin/lipoyl-binding protein [Verrucomicrobiae bacterium]